MAILYIVIVAIICSKFPAYVALTQGITISYRDENTTQDGQTILLGGLFPVHNVDGSIQTSAIQLVESMVLATRMVNKDPTLLPNITLTFDIRDTCMSVNYAIQQCTDYIQDVSHCNKQVESASGVVGAFLSTVSEATANLFGAFEVPQISYASTSSILSNFDYFFRTVPPDNYQAKVLAELVNRFKWTYIIILYSDDSHGRDGSVEFTKLLKNMSTDTRCIAAQIPLRHNPSNYKGAVDQMMRKWVSNASVVVLFGHTDNAIGILTEIKARTITDSNFPLQNITWIGSDSWGNKLPDEFHPMARGMLSVVHQVKASKAFDDYFLSLNPLTNRNPWFIEFWEATFNCSLGASPDLDDCEMNNQTLSRTATRYSQSNEVPLVFDAVFALAHSIHNIINDRCSNGELCREILSNYNVINGTFLRQQLLNVSFPSTVSEKLVSFDENGDVSGSYYILNLQSRPNKQYSFEIIGTWDMENHLSITEDIEWIKGDKVPVSKCSEPCGNNQRFVPIPDQEACCFRCMTCQNRRILRNGRCIPCKIGFIPNKNHSECMEIPVTYFTWSDPVAIFIVVLGCIGIMATLIVIAVFAIYFNNDLIKASSRELSLIQLAGILLSFTLPFFYTAKPSTTICGIRKFGIGTCFSLSYSALLVKTNRIHRIFNRKPSTSLKLRFISPLSQVLMTCGLIGVQILNVAVFSVVEPPGTEIILSNTEKKIICSPPTIGIAVSLGYDFLLLIISTYFAFLARKVPDNYNEAKIVGVTLYTTCIIWLAFVPAYFATVNREVTYQVISLMMGTVLSAFTTLSCLYLSKIVILIYHLYGKKADDVQTVGTVGSTHTTEIVVSKIPL